MPEFRILGKNPLAWWRRTVRSRGVIHALRVAWYAALDSGFDYWNGTDTTRRIHPTRIQTDSANRTHSSYYGATRALPFFGLLKQLNLPKDITFVDLGSGKGRVVLLAAEWGFRKVVGIEFSGPLCEINRNNLVAYKRRHALKAQVEIIESDVTQYVFQKDDRVCFLFDPFDSVILEQVLRNLKQSLRLHPRTLWMIYNTPAEHAVVMGSGVFQKWQCHWVRGTEFFVYCHVPEGSHLVI
jgi:SAM-dependent methyltransferase